MIGDSESSISFDMEGFLFAGKSKQKVAKDFRRDAVVAILLNLDSSCPNKNTISLFREGVRICEPQPIPEALLAKPLFPAITFKSASIQVIELSDRMILDWACKSGLGRPKVAGSVDKPAMQFGVPQMDDNSVRRVLRQVAFMSNRSFVVPELQANLIAGERKAALNSLYQEKQVFLRELVSNAADALEKARFHSVQDEPFLGDTKDLEVKTEHDSDAKTISITDTGVGRLQLPATKTPPATEKPPRG